MSHAASGRLLVTLYTVLALASGARAALQLATRFSAAPVAYLLSLAAALVYLAIAIGLRVPGPRARRLVWIACVAELLGVLTVGAFTLLASDALGDQTVWTTFGSGYGFVPLVLPAAALWWLTLEGSRIPATPRPRNRTRGERGQSQSPSQATRGVTPEFVPSADSCCAVGSPRGEGAGQVSPALRLGSPRAPVGRP